ncbi:MAG: hypothetical protein ACTHMV_11055 [Chitinophagaceae bacterium]
MNLPRQQSLTQATRKWPVYLPVAGIVLFSLLYVIATLLYPGGSDIDRHAKGFNWLHNYWCELMAPYSQNGQPNTARSLAISAMCVLAASLALIWYFVPSHLPFSRPLQKFISLCGVLSMAILFFLFSYDHDQVINMASTLGFMAILLTSAGLYRKKMFLLFGLGVIGFLLGLLNTWLYYSGQRYYLPVVQKITFIFFLAWFVLLRLRNK